MTFGQLNVCFANAKVDFRTAEIKFIKNKDHERSVAFPKEGKVSRDATDEDAPSGSSVDTNPGGGNIVGDQHS